MSLYGTAHDNLNGHGQGLRGLSAPTPVATANGWSMESQYTGNLVFGNQNQASTLKIALGSPYAKVISWTGDLASGFNVVVDLNASDPSNPQIAQYDISVVQTPQRGGGVSYSIGSVAITDDAAQTQNLIVTPVGIEVNAPVSIKPPEIGAPATAAPIFQVVTSTPTDLVSRQNYLSRSDFKIRDQFGNDYSSEIKGVSLWQWGGSFILGLDVGSLGALYFGWAGAAGWSLTDNSAFGNAPWVHVFGVSLSAFPALDSGFQYVIPLNASKEFLTTQGVSDADVSQWYITNSFILTSAPAIISGPSNSTQGFPIPPSQISDIWEVKIVQTFVDPNVNYIGWAVFYKNLTKQTAPQVWSWDEPSGSGGFSFPLGLISRIIVDVSTFGTAEAARAAAQAAGVPQKDIDLATEAGAALATAIVTVGGISALSATAPIVAADSSGFTAGEAGITTATEAGAGAAPAAAETVTAGEVGVTTATGEAATGEAAAVTAATGATVPSAVGTVATAAGGVASKAVAATIVSAGATALSTEIKKLTGQLPGAAVVPPSQIVQGSMPIAVSPASKASLLKWGLGIFAGLAILKKNS